LQNVVIAHKMMNKRCWRDFPLEKNVVL